MASSSASGGRIVGSRRASSVFPDPAEVPFYTIPFKGGVADPVARQALAPKADRPGRPKSPRARRSTRQVSYGGRAR